MATQHSIETLRARVEALGHKLVTYPGLIERPPSDEELEYTGLYILDPKTDRLVIATTGDAEGDAREIAGWCDECEAGDERIEYDPAESKLRDRAAALGLELMTIRPTSAAMRVPRYAIAEGARIVHNGLTLEGAEHAITEEEAREHPDDSASETRDDDMLAECERIAKACGLRVWDRRGMVGAPEPVIEVVDSDRFDRWSHGFDSLAECLAWLKDGNGLHRLYGRATDAVGALNTLVEMLQAGHDSIENLELIGLSHLILAQTERLGREIDLAESYARKAGKP